VIHKEKFWFVLLKMDSKGEIKIYKFLLKSTNTKQIVIHIQCDAKLGRPAVIPTITVILNEFVIMN